MMNKPALKQQMRAVGADLARAADRIARGDALGAAERLYDGLRRLAGAVGLVIDAEAPQDVLQEPVPALAAIVTDDQVREFARPRRWHEPAAFEMLMNAAFTIESLSRDLCDRSREIMDWNERAERARTSRLELEDRLAEARNEIAELKKRAIIYEPPHELPQT